MKVTENQIKELYSFVQKHHVKWYDVQTELVDHLANNIESIWEEEPRLTFEKAKAKAFNKFGASGFSDIVKVKESVMYKYYFKYFRNELKIWFTFPKLIITVALFLMFYTAFSSVISYYLYYVFFGTLVFWSAYKFIKHNKEYRLRKARSNKKWLLENLLYKQAGGIVFMLCCFILPDIIYSRLSFENSTSFLLSFVFTLMSLYIYINLEVLPNKVDALLKKAYPEYNFA